MTGCCDQVSALTDISLTHAQSYLSFFPCFFPHVHSDHREEKVAILEFSETEFIMKLLNSPCELYFKSSSINEEKWTGYYVQFIRNYCCLK